MSDDVNPNPSAIALGRVGRVVAVEDDGHTFHARMQSGGAARVSATQYLAVDPGDTVLIGESSWQVVPDDVWFDERSIGIVRLIEKKGVLLETALGLRFLRKVPRKKLNLVPGNTVEFDDFHGVTRVVSDTPIRARDSGVEQDVLKEYLVKHDPENGPTFDSFGGYHDVRERAVELIETQLNRKDALDEMGARPVKGIIFTGPPGTGKTHLARVIAHESKATFFLVSGPSIVSKWLGDSEDTLRRIFEAAASEERAIIFFDEIDSIAERRTDDSHEASKRLVAQLLTLMDGFDQKHSNVVVIAATNRIEQVEPALLRPGRFDWEIPFGLPTAQDRLEILQVRAKELKTTGDLPLAEVASMTDGWSAARLNSIWTEAGLVAAGDGRKSIADEDVAQAFERVQSRASREMNEVDHVA